MKVVPLVIEGKVLIIEKKDVRRKNGKKIVGHPIKNSIETLIKESDSTEVLLYITQFQNSIYHGPQIVSMHPKNLRHEKNIL